MINGKRQKVKKEEINDLMERVLKLTSYEVDSFFLECGFICEEKAEGCRALNDSMFDALQGGRKGVFMVMDNLIAETPKEIVFEKLSLIEQRKRK